MGFGARLLKIFETKRAGLPFKTQHFHQHGRFRYNGKMIVQVPQDK
jgi:hypothetical protein